jgi:signal peptide peptidase SppA
MPYPNEHACRLRDPDDFREDSFVRVSRETDDGRRYDVIRAELVSDGTTQDQSHRYPTDTWSEADARQHCQEHGGIKFEPATGGEDDDDGDADRFRVNTDGLGAPRFFQSLADQVWAVQSPAVLRELAHIGQRGGSVEAVERWRTERADGSDRVRVRNGVAIFPLMGPIFPKANLFTEISGATSIGVMARDLQQMADRSDIRAIMLEVDSPGGAVTDVDQMASIIAEIGRQKPITAYVGGTAASAAYWLATAAREIVVTRTGQVGGIGVVATVPKQQAPDEMGMMDFEIVSSGAPDKRPDPEAEAGRQAVLDRINPIEETFIATVAENRGVTPETVRADFGRGNVVVGNAAVRRRMADRIGTFEGVLQELQQVPFPQSTGAAASAALSQSQEKEVDMAEGTEAQAEARTSATTAQQPAAAGGNQAANPADVVELCNGAGVPEMAAGLIREGATYEQVRERVNNVSTMQETCDLAVANGFLSKDKAEELRTAAIKAGKSAEELGHDLLTASFRAQTPDSAVQSTFSPDAGTGGDPEKTWADKFAKVSG